MSLPYSVLMGEDLAIQVVVFNYNDKSIQVNFICCLSSLNPYIVFRRNVIACFNLFALFF